MSLNDELNDNMNDNKFENSIIVPDERGIVLENNITLSELLEIEPKYFDDIIKFVVDKDTNRVAVGMEVHKSAEVFFGTNHGNLFGGNIIIEDGSIVYSSTLNIEANIKNFEEKHKGIFKKKERFKGNPRTITDEHLQNIINATLFSWVDMKG